MLNKAVLMGRITATPELRMTNSGVPVTSFTVAVDRPVSRGAEKQTDFIDCVAWRNTAEFVCKYFPKGSPIVVEGRIQVSNFTTKEGENRKKTEIVADNINFCVGAPRNVESPMQAAPGGYGQPAYQQPAYQPAYQQPAYPQQNYQPQPQSYQPQPQQPVYQQNTAAPVPQPAFVPDNAPAAFANGSPEDFNDVGGGEDDLPF